MAFKYYGDLVFSTGEYKDKDGNDKKRWTKAGAVFQDGETGKMSIKFEAFPAGNEWSGWMKIFTKDNDQKAEPQNNKTNVINDEPIDLSKIPF